MEAGNKPWEIITLGKLSPKDKAEFYETLSEEGAEKHLFSDKKNSKLYENPMLEVAIINETGEVISPSLHSPKKEFLGETTIDISLDRYYVAAMPGNLFDLQIALSSRHLFENRSTSEQISHTMVAKGVLGSFINYFSEPVFQNLKIANMLTLDLAVSFLTDRSTERLIKCLKDENLKKGIQLASQYNPVFNTAATFVKGIVETLGSAKKNTPITDHHITFYSSPDKFSTPLIEGSYLLFQPSSEKEDLSTLNLKYDFNRDKLMEDEKEFEHNYMILSVKKH